MRINSHLPLMTHLGCPRKNSLNRLFGKLALKQARQVAATIPTGQPNKNAQTSTTDDSTEKYMGANKSPLAQRPNCNDNPALMPTRNTTQNTAEVMVAREAF